MTEFFYILLGIIVGILSGLFGIGGGIVMVPALIVFFGKGGGIIIVPLLIGIFHYNPKMATATSLAALQLPVGLPSVIVYAQNGHLHILNAALIAVGIVVGTLLGSKLAVKLPSATFKKVYAVFLLFVAIFMVYKYL